MEKDLESGNQKRKKKPPIEKIKTIHFHKVQPACKKVDDEETGSDYCMCSSHVHTGTQLVGFITFIWCLTSAIRCFAATSLLITCSEGITGLVCSILLLAGNRRGLWPYYIPFILFYAVDIASWLAYATYLLAYELVEQRLPERVDLVVMFKPVALIDDWHRHVFGALLVLKSLIYVYMVYVVVRGMLFLRRGGRLPDLRSH